MFEYNGKEYTLAQVEAAASAANLSLEEYIKKAGLNTIEPGKTPPTTPDAVVEETAASDQSSMELDSVDTSSELQKIEYVRDGKGGFIPKPIQPDIDISLLPETSEPATDEEIEQFSLEVRKDKEAFIEGEINKLRQSPKQNKIINSLDNMAARISGFDEQLNITSTKIAQKIFGVEAMDKFLNNPDINDFWKIGFRDEDIENAVLELEKIERARSIRETGSFYGGLKKGDIKETGAGIFDIITSFGASALTAGPYGIGLLNTFFADSFVNINTKRAKELGVDRIDFIQSDQADFYSPLVIGGLSGLAEKFGIKGVSQAISGIKSGVIKKITGRLSAGGKEGATEWLQGLLESAEEPLAKRKSNKLNKEIVGEISNSIENYVFSEQALESFLSGFVGGGIISTGLTASKEEAVAMIAGAATALAPEQEAILAGSLSLAQIRSASAKLRNEKDINLINKKVDEITTLKKEKLNSADKEILNAIDESINNRKKEISEIIKKSNLEINLISEKDLKTLSNLPDLAKQFNEKLSTLNKKYRIDKTITKEEFDIAREVYKEQYLTIKKEIENKVNDISQKNLNISSENERLISIIKNPKSSEIAIQKAKNDIVKNNEGLVNKLINSVYDPQIQSGLTKEDVSGKAYAEVAALINSYKPDSKVPFGAYLKQNLTKRVPSFFEIVETKDGEIIGKVDVTEQKTLADDLDVELGTDIAIEATTAQQNKVREAVGITQEQSVDIGKKILRGRLPGVTERIKGKQKGFLSAIRKAAKTALTTDMLAAIGGNFTEKEAQISDYTSMLDILYEDLVNNIPNEYKNVQFADLFNPTKVGRAKTAVGEGKFEYTIPTKEEFIDFFTNLNHPTITATSEAGKYNQLRARKVRIAEALAEVVGARGVREALELDSTIEKEFKERQDLLDKEIPDAPGGRIIAQIDSWIEQWDQLFKPEPGELRASFGAVELLHASGKIFLQSLKASTKAGIRFADAVKKAIKEVQNFLTKEGASELEQQEIVNTLDKTTEKDLNLKAGVYYNKIKTEFKGNLAKRINENYVSKLNKEIKNIFDSKISDEQKLYKLGEILNRDLRAIRNTFKKGDGYNLNTTQLVYDNIIKSAIPSNLRKFVKVSSGKININVDGYVEKQSLDLANPNTKLRDELSKTGDTKEDFKLAAEKHDADASKFRRLILSKLEEFKNIKDVEGAKAFLQMQGQHMTAAGRNMFPLRILSLTKDGKLPNKIIPEHNPPYNDAVNLMLQYVKGEINLEQLNEALDTFSVDILDAELAPIYNKTTKNTIGAEHDFTKDPKKARYNEEYQNALKENNQEFFDLKEDKTIEDSKKEFNSIVTEATGINSEISGSRAEALAKNKNRLKLLPPSADDFAGLLYYLAGKGKKGAADLAFFKKTFLDPFAKAMVKFDASKQETLKQYNRLKKLIRKTPAKLSKQNSTGFTNETSIRIYIWNKLGYTIPDITEQEIKDSIELVEKNKDLNNFANNIINISVLGYAEPDSGWTAGTITTDLLTYVNEKARAEFLTEWEANIEATFTKENINKLKAQFGDNYTEALEDILYRMKTGRRRPMGGNKLTNNFFNWISDSVGAIMFFNTRSALLQQLSFTNFLNFEDNNPIAAAAAFANQKQFWKDYATLFNSDYLKQRRSGVKTDVNADEIAKKVEQGGNIYRNTIAVLLKKGFLPTQIADSNAIAMGGASFYRNRIKKYIKEGFTEKDAEQKAFVDFQEASEETQQSSRPDRISMQQASPLGRIILNFGNVLMQYNRRALKDIKDIIAKRPLPGKTIGESNMTRIPRILYYLALQNIVFNSLQSALFALAFSDEEEEEEKNKYFRIANGTADGILRGLGFGGAAVSVGKNMVLEAIKQYESGRPNYEKVGTKILSISPPVDSKIRKLQAAGRAFTYRQTREKMITKGISIENPAFEAVGQVVSGLTNIPADRVIRKIDNLSTAATQDVETWQAISLALGYSKWDVGLIESQAKKPKPKGLKTKKLKTKKLK
jgi:hypothetical protein